INSIKNNCPLNIKSFINALHAHYNDQGFCDYMVVSKFDDFNEAEMLKYIEYINYGADAAVLTYSIPDVGSHAVVCFGMQYRDEADDKNSECWGKEYDKRILLYDVNYSYFTYDKCIYIDSETGNWKMEDTRGNTKVNDGFKIIYKANTMFPGRNSYIGLDLVKKLASLAR
ncbi:MAG: hypothetical protein IKL31_02310, partial [Ruminococcus sp.]|nr:hypothetical protein [Ruminococcus sp.]